MSKMRFFMGSLIVALLVISTNKMVANAQSGSIPSSSIVGFLNHSLTPGCSPDNNLTGLTWCMYNNPYILSDFLSRNSSELTRSDETASPAAANAMTNTTSRPQPQAKTFSLNILCDSDDTLGNGTASASFQSKCSAIREMRTATLGNGTSEKRLVVFTDNDGQMLFVDFNTNTMLSTFSIPVERVVHFDVQSALTNNTATQTIDKNVVLLVGNGSMVSFTALRADGGPSPTCIVVNFPGAQFEGVKLALGQFDRKTPAINVTDVISFIFGWQYPLPIWVGFNGGTPKPWMDQLLVYEIGRIPAQQGFILPFLHHCNASQAGMHQQFNARIFSTVDLRFKSFLNTASNISYLMAYSNRTVNIFNFNKFSHTKQPTPTLTWFDSEVPLYIDWCEPKTIFNYSSGEYVTLPRATSTVFCVPDESTVITAVEMFSPDNFQSIGTFVNDLWIVISLRNATSTWMHAMDFTELVLVNESRVTFSNPLGLPSNIFSPTFPCPFDTQFYNPYLDRCQNRYVIRRYFEGNDDVSSIMARGVQGTHRAWTAPNASGGNNANPPPPPAESTASVFTTTSGTAPMTTSTTTEYYHSSTTAMPTNTTQSNWTLPPNITLPPLPPNFTIPPNFTLPPSVPSGGNPIISIPTVQDDYVGIFVAHGHRVSVFTLYTKVYNQSHLPELHFDFANDILFLGGVLFLYVTPNAQHLFTAITRHKWEIEAQNRYVDLCKAWTKKPSDPFLAPFGDACRVQPGQPVNLNSFTQYASYCSFNSYCPTFDLSVAEFPLTGEYADRPGVKKRCPPGSFCFGGQKQPCPPGFYCDEEGMSQPKRCEQSVAYNMTCSNWGQVTPEPCPQGSVCLVPHIPGLPAPPGGMVPAPNTGRARTDFLSCPAGSWCPIGAQQPYNGSMLTAADYECPAFSFCSNSSVLEPTVCQCDANDVIDDGAYGKIRCHSRTLYCPTGTTNVTWCPAGYYCAMPNASVRCVPTQYCPQGTFAPQLCPAGNYCPQPNVSIPCPVRHYCPQGSTNPVVCNYLTYCPVGSASQSRSFLAPVVLVAVVLGVLVAFYGYTRWDKKRQNEAQSVQPVTPAVQAFVSQGGADDDEDYLLRQEKNGGNNNGAVPSSPSQTSLLSMNAGGRANRPLVPTSSFTTPTIRFEHMGLSLGAGEFKGKVVLDDVTGTIPPGSFVAVMGPSGSGKSTFMHTLAGKAFYGKRLGKVLVNNDEVDLTAFGKVIGFVKQDDIMIREMTVSETLLFNARMRYDSRTAVDTPEGIANATLKVLDLGHVRDTNIGDEKKRGISGGQRKRVNIGMEMCALPSILFLDEPTSGLDSSSSMTVCRALRDMADAGVTVISVIHQPRYEIFNMFHKVLLLAKGGKLVYYGPPSEAMDYFEQRLHFKCPPHVNPPDFFMDTISGENSEGMTIDDMVQVWQKYESEKGVTNQHGAAAAVASDTENLNLGGGVNPSGKQLAAEAGSKRMASFVLQVRLYTERAVVQLSRDLIWFFTDLILVLVAGFFLGLVFSSSEYRPPLPQQIINRSLEGFGPTAPPSLVEFFNRPIDDPIISEASLTCMAIGMTGVTAALRVFGNEQIVYWREASAGMSGVAYFIAKNLSHVLFIVLSPLLYLAPFLTFVSTRAAFYDYYWVVLLTQFATTGLGYLISAVVPSGLAQLAGVVMVLVFSMFGGARPTLIEIKQMFPLLQIMPYISYIRWAQEALYLIEIRKWGEVEGVNIQPSLDLFGYSLNDGSLCLWLVVGFGVLFRVLAAACMLAMNRHQKQ